MEGVMRGGGSALRLEPSACSELSALVMSPPRIGCAIRQIGDLGYPEGNAQGHLSPSKDHAKKHLPNPPTPRK